jgi:hypothetical protein
MSTAEERADPWATNAWECGSAKERGMVVSTVRA